MIIIASTTSEESTRAQIVDALNMFWCPKGTPLKGDSYALIIDGDSLKYALMPGCKDLLLELACRCKSVICCRVSPKQKAKVVSLVRKGLVSDSRTALLSTLPLTTFLSPVFFSKGCHLFGDW